MVAQSRAIPVIVTRPSEQGARFAKELQDQFGKAIDVIQSPLLAPQFLQPEIGPGPWTAVIFTSATAVRALNLPDSAAAVLPRKAYCVGDQTAESAREMGFDAVSAKGNAAALCSLIRDTHVTGPLVHLRGEEALGEIAKVLNLEGIETQEAIVYREVAQTLSLKARVILASDVPTILPVFSPRTGTILARELTSLPHLAPVLTVAISAGVADTLDTIMAAHRIIARHPEARYMLAAVAEALIAAQAA